MSAKQPVAEGGLSHTRLAKDKSRVLARQILLLNMGLVLSTIKASEKCITQTETRLLTFLILHGLAHCCLLLKLGRRIQKANASNLLRDHILV